MKITFKNQQDLNKTTFGELSPGDIFLWTGAEGNGEYYYMKIVKTESYNALRLNKFLDYSLYTLAIIEIPTVVTKLSSELLITK